MCLIFISLLFPEFNPDLFWHLAAGRKAQELGRWMLSFEVFSFTKNGSYWINYEWLFEWIVYHLYQWGDYRALVFARAVLVSLTILAGDRYFGKFLKANGWGGGFFGGILRVSNILLLYMFVISRATMQPELFSLLFLVLFLFLRDRWVVLFDSGGFDRLPGGAGLTAVGVILLFGCWANLHGGFVYAMTILGLQGIARMLGWINLSYRWRRDTDLVNRNLVLATDRRRLSGEFNALFSLGILCLAGTLMNPYGVDLFRVIFLHLRDSSFISGMIQEWQPTQFYQLGSLVYWWLFVFVMVSILGSAWISKSLDFESSVLSLGFGIFAANHVRNMALFGVVVLPIFWKQIIPAVIKLSRWPWSNWVFSWQRHPWRSGRALVLAGLVLMMGCGVGWSAYFMGEHAWLATRNMWRMRGIPRPFVSLGDYPYLACQFVERNPELLKLKIFTEWGWGGLAIWVLHEKGARFYFDGRYLFHHLLQESMKRADNPAQWSDYLRKKGVQMFILRHPKNDEYQPMKTVKTKGQGYDRLIRSWHSQAFPASQWAMVWWDQASMVFVLRKAVDQKWLATREYENRINMDLLWVEYQVRMGVVNADDIEKELRRNISEVGLNSLNHIYLEVVRNWRAGRFPATLNF